MTAATQIEFSLDVTSEDDIQDIIQELKKTLEKELIVSAEIEDRVELSSKEIIINIVISFAVSVSANFATEWLNQKIAEIKNSSSAVISHSLKNIENPALEIDEKVAPGGDN